MFQSDDWVVVDSATYNPDACSGLVVKESPDKGDSLFEKSDAKLEDLRRTLLEDILVERNSIEEIAEQFGLSKEQVKIELAELKKDWSKRRLRLTTERVAREVGFVEEIRSLALVSFHHSLEGTVISVEKNKQELRPVDDGDQSTGPVTETETKITHSGSHGDPRFLAIALKASERLAALFGLDKRSIGELTPRDDDGSRVNYSELDPAELERLIDEKIRTSRQG